MKNPATIIITVLWLITITVSIIVLSDTNYFSTLGPVYFICMIGSIITVYNASNGSNKNGE
jgi:hypothetical protein